MFKRLVKGDFNYIKNKRNRVILFTIIYFAISLGIIIIGYVTTGTKRNLLTVVGILGCLPACKSTVNMIMFLKAKGCSEKVYKAIEPFTSNLIPMYDMYFTSYTKNYDISNMVINKNIILGFSEDSKFDIDECITHLSTMLKQAGHKGFTISLTKDLDKYLNMLSKINNDAASSDEQIKDDELRTSLYEIIL